MVYIDMAFTSMHTPAHRRNAQKTLPHIVTIGGGTGSFVLLSGLKQHPVRISAIVSMADDGGSTGVLRDEMGVLPPGDVRQCLAALARATPEVRQLFNYRFENGRLTGHNAGNLFLSALEKTTGSFTKAVAVAGKILNVYGRVIPVSEGDMRLVVTLNDGTVKNGERALDDDEAVRAQGVAEVSLAHPVQANPDALTALAQADVVTLGPGDLYGSIVPNLLVGGIAEALRDTPARVVVIANLTNKRGLTDGFTAHEYVRAIESYIGEGSVDTLICNTQEPDAALTARYEAQEGEGAFVACEPQETRYRVIREALLQEHHDDASHIAGDSLARSFIRHDSEKLAESVIACLP